VNREGHPWAHNVDQLDCLAAGHRVPHRPGDGKLHAADGHECNVDGQRGRSGSDAVGYDSPSHFSRDYKHRVRRPTSA